VYATDLWKVFINGENAIRLTSNAGSETRPQFPKDGNWIAFTAQYDGNTDIFLVSKNGGKPKY
jgi:tricorn protease